MAREFKPKPIDQQTLLLSGISDELGYELVLQASRSGAKVMFSGRDEEKIHQCHERIIAEGRSAVPIISDSTKLSEVYRLKKELLKNFGDLDAWINCGSLAIEGLFLDSEVEQEKKHFEINYWSARMGTQVATELLSEHGGVIINIGSDVSCSLRPLLGPYCVSKSALKVFTDAYRSELKGQGFPIELCLIRPDAKLGFELNANSILKCLITPKRDVYVGGPARLTAIMETFFPEVKDLMTENQMKTILAKANQQRTDQ